MNDSKEAVAARAKAIQAEVEARRAARNKPAPFSGDFGNQFAYNHSQQYVK